MRIYDHSLHALKRVCFLKTRLTRSQNSYVLFQGLQHTAKLITVPSIGYRLVPGPGTGAKGSLLKIVNRFR